MLFFLYWLCISMIITGRQKAQEKLSAACFFNCQKTDNSEYDYPQFALPLYNLCSNVGLYETAAITNRSNILSPKYLRLNL